MDLWEKFARYKGVIFVILFIPIIFYWISSPEEVDDPYIISIEYDCRSVMKDSTNIPMEVVEECKTVIEEQNAIKRSKSST